MNSIEKAPIIATAHWGACSTCKYGRGNIGTDPCKQDISLTILESQIYCDQYKPAVEEPTNEHD